MEHSKNIIGPQVRRLRDSRGWTQEDFAAKCGVAGFDLSRASLSKIEAGLRRVVDAEIPLLAKALRVEISELFPKKASR